MSAGICILNKNAIAMAADSAVTIGHHAAIHNSANKLFSLSRYEPIGVIIYANASFMEIPMEIIIKQYKVTLGNQSFPSLEEYVDDFIAFMENNCELFHFDKNEETYVTNVYTDLLAGLHNGYKRLIEIEVQKVQRQLNDDELKKIAQQAYDETIEYISGQETISGANFSQYVTNTYLNKINAFVSAEFKWLSADQIKELCSKLCTLYDTKFFRNGYVGIAIAGYGKKDIFPKMSHIHLGGIINGKTRYILREKITISENNNAAIAPLAQTDVMQTFLFGINDSFIQDMANEIPKQINNCIATANDELFAEGKKAEVQNLLLGTTPKIIQQIGQNANNRYMNPIINSVATLPIEELALLAESMINITSLRRKVALDGNIGTVGGPIDVAIITRGDGLIWMKRKHYFDLKYNPQYIYTHYNHSTNNCPEELLYENTETE